MNQYVAYIMASNSRVLYAGMTNELPRRVVEHRQKLVPGFTARYNCVRLVWYEVFSNVNDAIECEKKIKGWRRSKKIALIEQLNPQWDDLSL